MGALGGRVIVVTGAARGLGRAYAMTCADEGASVIVNDVPDAVDELEELVKAIQDKGGHAVSDTHNVALGDDATQLVDRTIREFGEVHCIVNNAGVIRDSPVDEMTDAQWNDVIAVHLTGSFNTIRASSRYWVGRARLGSPIKASIVNITSGSGLFAVAGQINYCAAKGGILSMTLAAARELADHGIRVNAVSPGARTRGTWFPAHGCPEENYSSAHGAEMTPMVAPPSDGSFDEWHPDNVAPVVAWLAQEDCAATGQVLRVRGGHIRIMEGWRAASGLDQNARWTVAELNSRLTPLAVTPPAWDVADFEPTASR